MPYKDPKSPRAIESRKRRSKRYRERHPERVREQARKSYRKNFKKNKEKYRARCNDYYYRNVQKFLDYGEKWREAHPERAAENARRATRMWRDRNPNYSKERIQKLRLIILKHYGGDPPKCRFCGENHIEFLTVDHILGGGSQHRKKVGGGTRFYSWLIKNGFPEGFQILCWNCNISKYIEISRENLTTKEQRYKSKYASKIKFEAISHYSNGTMCCACCGKGGIGNLAIDHIEGNGSEHRRETKTRGGFAFYLWLRKNGFPDGYRVLCHNCNSALGLYGYCPHQK